MWNWKNVSVASIVIGALGTVIKVLDVAKELELLQKVCLLGTARILRRV